jgi:hypothetical protein
VTAARIKDRIARVGISGQGRTVTSPPQPLILTDEEAERQRALLVRLKVALDGLGVRAVVARNHHIGLPTEYVPVSAACGLKPPILFVCPVHDGVIRIQVSDQSYVLPTGESVPVADTETAAQEITSLMKATRVNRPLPLSGAPRGGGGRHA